MYANSKPVIEINTSEIVMITNCGTIQGRDDKMIENDKKAKNADF